MDDVCRRCIKAARRTADKSPVSLDASSPPVPAGWYSDPEGAGLRYWDGAAWTENSAPSPDDGPGATKGDWIAGVLLSLIMPVLGLIGGVYYAYGGGQRARVGWMCIGLSITAGIVLYTLDPYGHIRPEPGAGSSR